MVEVQYPNLLGLFKKSKIHEDEKSKKQKIIFFTKPSRLKF